MDGRILADLFAMNRALRVDQKTTWRGTNQVQHGVSVADISKGGAIGPERMQEIYIRAYSNWEHQAQAEETRKMWYDPLLMTLFLENTLP